MVESSFSSHPYFFFLFYFSCGRQTAARDERRKGKLIREKEIIEKDRVLYSQKIALSYFKLCKILSDL